MRLLDLFCGGGGAAMGYHRAGFEVVGVDLARQWAYPFEFHRADALTFPLEGFDVVHASPPCKLFTGLHAFNKLHHPPRLFEPHADLLTPILARLREWGGVWIVENVPGAPMPADAVTVCGSAFGLRVRRHRLFASSVPIVGTVCDHAGQGKTVGVYGNGGSARLGAAVKVWGREAADALGIDWTDDQKVLSQAIPPAYTEWLGRQLELAVVA